MMFLDCPAYLLQRRSAVSSPAMASVEMPPMAGMLAGPGYGAGFTGHATMVRPNSGLPGPPGRSRPIRMLYRWRRAGDGAQFGAGAGWVDLLHRRC